MYCLAPFFFSTAGKAPELGADSIPPWKILLQAGTYGVRVGWG